MYEFYKKLPGSPICVLGCFGRAWDTHQATASLLLEAKAQKQALSLSLSLSLPGLNRILPLSLSLSLSLTGLNRILPLSLSLPSIIRAPKRSPLALFCEATPDPKRANVKAVMHFSLFFIKFAVFPFKT